MPSVFLSHNQADKSFVRQLANDLKSRGCDVWFDEWEIKVGDSIIEKIEKGIADNEYLVVALSKDSVKSRWVRVELNAALFRQLGNRGITVLPALIEDCDVPTLICDRRYADFRHDYQTGLDAILVAVGCDSGSLPLDRMELALLHRLSETGEMSWWRETVTPTYEESVHDETVERLKQLGLVTLKYGRAFGSIDSGTQELICGLTELGKKRLEELRRRSPNNSFNRNSG